MRMFKYLQVVLYCMLGVGGRCVWDLETSQVTLSEPASASSAPRWPGRCYYQLCITQGLEIARTLPLDTSSWCLYQPIIRLMEPLLN